MNTQQVSAELAGMALTPGVKACALVDSATGMVYLSAGSHPQIDAIAEAASDYWRLHQRSGVPFAGLGPLQAISMIHRDGVLSLPDAVALAKMQQNGLPARHPSLRRGKAGRRKIPIAAFKPVRVLREGALIPISS